jgi:hypothetical protein
LEEKLKNLNIEKVIYIKELKRIRDENYCRFSKKNKDRKSWPMLKNRY